MNNPEKLNIILFCNRPTQKNDAGTIIDHIDSFSKYSALNIFVFSNWVGYPSHLDLNKFDVLVIHYSSYLLNNFYISPKGKKHIAAFKGLKILFLQDEYRRIYDFHNQIRQLGIHLLFTCLPEGEIEKVYPLEALPNLIKVNNLTGYVPENLLHINTPAIIDRPIDVGYRSRKLPYWYGRLAVEKWQIVDNFLHHTQGLNLKCDLSYDESQRIYGNKWLEFVQNCKTMLGVESGASVIDFSGRLEREVEAYQAANPGCTFEEVYEKYLQGHDGKITMNQISPRCFEAIALKTPLVLFEGNYSNILVPERHYIPLKKDFSNISEVVAKIKDHNYLQELADRAYNEITLNKQYSYQYFIENFDKLVSETFANKGFIKTTNPYTSELFVAATRLPLLTRIKKALFMRARAIKNRLPRETQYKIRKIARFLKVI